MPCALPIRSEEHTSELQSPCNLVCRVLYRSDRKSTRLNSSHLVISYAVFCLKKKTYLSALITLAHADSHQFAAVRKEGAQRRSQSCAAAKQQACVEAVIRQPFFFKDPAPTEIYTLPLHDALPISIRSPWPCATCWNKASHIRSPPGNHNSSE